MNHFIFVSIQCLLISMSSGATSGNFQRAGKVRLSKIIFFNDDHEPLLPRPTFSPNVKPSRFRTPAGTTGPPKQFTNVPRSPPLAERKRPVSSTTARPKPTTDLSPTIPPPKSIYKYPGTTETASTTPTSRSTTLKTSGSNPSKSVLVEPMLDGSFYVPFKIMNISMNNGTRSN